LRANPAIVRCLDAGGGTGNAASLLVEMGLRPVVLDVSPEMLARWKEKASSLGHDADVIAGDVATYLEQEPSEWDLIVFSSVLHHLDHPESVLRAAARRLAPGGVLVTVFDPIDAGRFGKALRRGDWMLYATIHDRSALAGALKARIEGQRTSGRDGPHIGQLAERHALRGLRDLEVAETLREAGLEILKHDRFYEARYRWVVAAFRVLHRPSSFSIVARRPALG
jgi:SAM-dependent methyltransferase